MDQVPKILKPLVNEWNPEGYIVSFKVSNPLRDRGIATHTFYPNYIQFTLPFHPVPPRSLSAVADVDSWRPIRVS